MRNTTPDPVTLNELTVPTTDTKDTTDTKIIRKDKTIVTVVPVVTFVPGRRLVQISGADAPVER